MNASAQPPLEEAVDLRARVWERLEKTRDPAVWELVDAILTLADAPYSDALAVAVLVEATTLVAEKRLEQDYPSSPPEVPC